MRNLLDKRGESSPYVKVLLTIGIIVAIIGVIGLYRMAVTGEEDVEDPTKCADSTGKLTVNAVSLLAGASDPSSPTITCGVDGDKLKTSVTSGTTTFAIGSKLVCLVSKSDFIDKSFTTVMPCGGLTEEVSMYYATSDNPAMTIKDPKSSDATVTDAIGGGPTNLTGPSAGATVKFDVYFEGTNTEGTGELIYVIEFPAGSGVNITGVTMGSLRGIDLPTVHSLVNAGSKAVAFIVPNIEGAIEPSYSVIATLGSAKDLTGGVYTDWYAGQEFIDDDGTLAESGIEDSDGTAKYENTADRDFYID